MDRASALDPSIFRFAERLRAEVGAERVILHGAYAMGFPSWDSDYELIVLSDRFHDVDPFMRSRGMHDIFYAVGGHAPLALVCLTHEEFKRMWPHDVPNERELPEAIDLLPVDARKMR